MTVSDFFGVAVLLMLLAGLSLAVRSTWARLALASVVAFVIWIAFG